MHEKYLRELLKNKGASLVGFCKLDYSPIENQPNLMYGVSIVKKLSDSVLRSIDGAPSMAYFQHYRTINFKLDQLALDAIDYIEKAGYNAFPIAASQSKPDNRYSGLMQHKTVARLAGLGYIGKNSMFITEEFGSKVRLATVLTDMPLDCDKQILDKNCGDCNICFNACPVGCIYGINFDKKNPGADLIDREKCSLHMKTYNHIGRGSVCGLCMRACPKNKL